MVVKEKIMKKIKFPKIQKKWSILTQNCILKRMVVFFWGFFYLKRYF